MRATQRTEVRSSARQLAKICESCTDLRGEPASAACVLLGSSVQYLAQGISKIKKT